MNGTFSPLMSTNEIYRDMDNTRCLTMDLEDLEQDVAGLQDLVGDTSVTAQIVTAIAQKANVVHTHEINDVTGLSSELSSKYEKPLVGIPKTDLDTDVQLSLNKADTAIQSLDGCATVDHEHTDYVTVDGLMNRTAITVSVLNESLTNDGHNCYYYPNLGMAFLRLYGVCNITMEAGNSYQVANISSYLPANNHALSIKCSNEDCAAIISSSGNIVITPFENISTGHAFYIAGFWFVPQA